MTQLSVNVNKIATLRNARGGDLPNLLAVTQDIIAFGAEGITVHPRPDERHIRKSDVALLAEHIDVEFNIEGYPSPAFLDLVTAIKPAQCTLVPDAADVLTSDAGWSIEKNRALLQESVHRLHNADIRSSLFIDPFTISAEEITQLKHEINTDRIELYTGPYAAACEKDPCPEILSQFASIANKAQALGIDINAGHDLNLTNLPPLLEAIPFIKEVSIGHALICDALYFGLKQTIARYLDCIADT